MHPTIPRKAVFPDAGGPVSLGAVLNSVPLARRLVREALAHWNLDPEFAYDAEVAASELITNAVRCTMAIKAPNLTVKFWLRWSTPELVIEVWDPSPDEPEPRRPKDDDIGGRGLGIVMHMSARRGVYQLEEGKVVWAALLHS